MPLPKLPLIDEILGRQDFIALRFQLQQHLVEGIPERRDIAVRRAYRDGHIEITCRDLVSRSDELANWTHQTIRHRNTGPYR